MTATPRARVDSGWFLVGQLVLAVLAVLSPALGAREGASSVLPPLRAETMGPSSEVAVRQREEDEIVVEAEGRTVFAAVLALALALGSGRRRSVRPSVTTLLRRSSHAWSRPPGRAPPLPA